MLNCFCRVQSSSEVVKVIEVEVDTTHNLNIHLHQIEYKELIKIHSMVNISACNKHLLYTAKKYKLISVRMYIYNFLISFYKMSILLI